jgi:hypothetical protein
MIFLGKAGRGTDISVWFSKEYAKVMLMLEYRLQDNTDESSDAGTTPSGEGSDEDAGSSSTDTSATDWNSNGDDSDTTGGDDASTPTPAPTPGGTTSGDDTGM